MLLIAGIAMAQEPQPFRVTGHSVHVEAEQAEVCLTFSHPIVIKDRSAVASKIKLEKEDRRVSVTGRDLSLTPTELCVQQLEHRHDYHLAVRDLRNVNGDVMDDPFTLDFTVGDRKPMLGFVMPASAGGLPRLEKTADKKIDNTAIKLRAVNVEHARLKLFRITDPKLFPEAWQQYQQSLLVPSESQYFVDHNSQIVWQSDLVFDEKANTEQSMTVALPGSDVLMPGLYFLSAAPQSELAKNPGLLAGMWFAISDIRATVMTSPDGLHLFTMDAAGKNPVANVNFQILARDGKVLGESTSSSEGIGFVALNSDQQKEAVLLTARTATNDIDLVDLKIKTDAGFSVLSRNATLSTDRPSYQPGNVAIITLLARDQKGHPQKIANSFLKLVRPNQVFYSEQAVPADVGGPIYMTVPVPVTNEAGEWILLWQQSDGTVLARGTLPLVLDSVASHFEVTADRELTETDGSVVLRIKALGNNSRPLAWRGGEVSGQQVQPEFNAWKNYRFGTASMRQTAASKPVHFITNADGTAQVKLQFALTGNSAESRAVKWTVKLDGALEPETITMPVRATYGWVGLRPLLDDRPFAENSLAVFNAVLIDTDRKRQAQGELFFQLYEEGRRFEWFPAEGHWTYQPLPQRRRLGGGRLNLNATGDNLIKWPVTAGHYLLEIVDSGGAVLASHAFDVGGTVTGEKYVSDDRLQILQPQAPLEPGRENIATILLKQPAMVSILIGDSKVRQTIHRYMTAGENNIAITPAEEWEHQVQIQAHAVFAGNDHVFSRAVLPLHHLQQDLDINVTVPERMITGRVINIPVTIAKRIGDEPVSVSLLATPLVDKDQAPVNARQLKVQTDKDGKATLQLEMTEFTGALQLTFLAWNSNQMAEKQLVIPARPMLAVMADPPAYVTVGDRTSLNIMLAADLVSEGTYNYLLTAPSGLNLGDNAKGTVKLKANESRNLSVAMVAIGGVRGNIKFELTGPNNFQTSHVWPITIRENRPIITSATQRLVGQQSTPLVLKSSKNGSIAMVSPAPLMDAPVWLHEVLATEPVTTEELARWLSVTRQWQSEMIAFGLSSGENLRLLRAARIQSLLQRQNNDGGFASQSDASSDLSSTALALMALHDEPGVDLTQGIIWLQRKLENTWFEETERAARATGFLALIVLERGDLSALRYFVGTSKEKELAPLTVAQIALTLALVKDRDEAMAREWLQRAHDSVNPLIESGSGVAWQVWEAIAINPLQPPREIIGAIEKTPNLKEGDAPVYIDALLRTVGTLGQRYGGWRATVNSEDKGFGGIALLPLHDKQATTIRNPLNDALYVWQPETDEPKVESKSEKDMSLQQQLFYLDGNRVPDGAMLERDQSYIILIHGQGKKDLAEGSISVTSPLTAGWRAEPMVSGNAVAMIELWPWLAPLADWQSHDLSTTGKSFVLANTDEWRVAYLIKPIRSGHYNLQLPEIRYVGGESLRASGNSLPIDVR